MTKGVWESYARVYDRIINLSSLYNELLERTKNELPLEGRILEVGCGTGNFLLKIGKSKQVIVYGVDKSKEMLEHARKKLSEEGINAILLEGDAADLPFQDGYFNGVACLNVLYAVPDPQKVISEIYRVLRTGGICVVSGPKPDQDFDLLVSSLKKDVEGKVSKEDLEEFIRINSRLIGNAKLFDNSEVEDMLSRAGFSIKDSSSAYLGQAYFVVAQK